MNNKLKELALKANLEYNLFLPDAWSGEDKDLEKFAELIIRECGNIAETYDVLLDEDDKECCICRKVAWKIADNINSKFGIE